jgi:uncharacterized membrane protein
MNSKRAGLHNTTTIQRISKMGRKQKVNMCVFVLLQVVAGLFVGFVPYLNWILTDHMIHLQRDTMVEALSYKLEARRFECWEVINIFQITNTSSRTMALGLPSS